MKIKSGWDIKILLDEVVYEFINIIYHISFLWHKIFYGSNLSGNKKYFDKHNGERCFLVGNGPSINKQDLKLLKDETTFFVNRAFLLEDYEYVKPTYHVIVDPKLGTGEWPITYLDEIRKKNPDVILVLDVGWISLPQFKPYLSWNIVWVNFKKIFTRFTRKKVDLTTINAGAPVIESCILNAIYMGFKDIYLLGVDYNGIFYDLLDMDSHAYGRNPENSGKNMNVIARDLMFTSMSFRRWWYIELYCKRLNVNLKNATLGGALGISRIDYMSLFKVKNGL